MQACMCLYTNIEAHRAAGDRRSISSGLFIHRFAERERERGRERGRERERGGCGLTIQRIHNFGNTRTHARARTDTRLHTRAHVGLLSKP